mgnify:CR=1 FL=1|tara:strand:- start:1188 stop:1859 length:672 start_codon:yes stop_codon:yes gene_type:complete
MPQLTNKKIVLYIFFFIIFGTFNNKNLDIMEFSKINEITVSGLNLEENFKFAKRLDILKIENLFLIEKIKLKKLIETNNSIEKYYIFKKYPSSLEIKIAQTEPLAYLSKNGKIFYLGSNSKLVDAENREKKLPFIFGDIDIQKFFDLKKLIDNSSLDYKKIKNLFFFPSKRWDIEMDSGILIKLPIEKLEESLNLSLDIIKNDEFKHIRIIDLRQNHQVILNE